MRISYSFQFYQKTNHETFQRNVQSIQILLRGLEIVIHRFNDYFMSGNSGYKGNEG